MWPYLGIEFKGPNFTGMVVFKEEALHVDRGQATADNMVRNWWSLSQVGQLQFTDLAL